MAMSATSLRSRWARLAVGVVATALLALTGCASANQPSDPASVGASADSGTGTRAVADATGARIQVPASPRRVVALTQQDLDVALALGVVPVGITNGQGQQQAPDYLADRVSGVPIVGDINRPTMDKVIEVEPDLILAGQITDAQVLDQLRTITPATAVTYQVADDWKTHLRTVARVLNKESEADRVLADYDAKVAEVRAGLGDNADAQVSIVRWNPKGPSYMQRQQFASTVVTDLGLSRPPGQQEDGISHSEPLSLEALNRLDGEWLFLSTLTADGAQALAAVRDTPAFNQLAAVRANHVVTVDGVVWTSRGGPLAALRVLDDVRRALAG